MDTVRNEIRQFIIENFLFGHSNNSLGDDESFLDSGIIDSTGVLQLLGYLEEHFGIAIGDADVTPANLDSVNRVVKFVEARRTAQPPPSLSPEPGTSSLRG
jgi:acyl carrier protein